jgi:hypothetical protein
LATKTGRISITTLVLTSAMLVITATQASTRERQCLDEPAEIQGVISVITNRSINLRGSQLGSFNVKDDNTGTCDIRDVIYRPAIPPECKEGSKFTAKGRAISGLARLVADSLVCE